MFVIPFCPSCGKNVDPGKRFCENCGAPLNPAPAAPPAAAPPYTQSPPPVYPQQPDMQAPSQKKSEGLAALASFLFSGLGQVYNGSFARGLFILLGAMIGSLFFFIPGLLIWAYGIYDAYATAKKMNEGLIPFVPHEMSHIIGFIILGIVIVIIYFVILVAAFSALMLGASSFY